MLLVCYGSYGKDALSRTRALMLVIFCSPLLSYAEELWQSGDIAASLRSATSGVPKVYDRWRSEATPKLPLRRAQVVDFFSRCCGPSGSASGPMPPDDAVRLRVVMRKKLCDKLLR
uniref:Putative secreted protein n=1 Tax=Ixodes ricinus TaxID=34613 RepID=A0A6B0UL74_IXORI